MHCVLLRRLLVAAALLAWMGCEDRAASTLGAKLDASVRDAGAIDGRAGDAAVEAARALGEDASRPLRGDAGTAVELDLTVEQGTLRGKLEGNTREFFGIPYAAPPVGARRFAPPQGAAPWTGVRDATAFAPDCLHPDMPGSIPTSGVPRSEDCLYLNVWTPRAIRPGGVPVFVHALSGGFRYGGSADIDGRMLSEAANAIVVVPNFRQGPLGYLVHDSLDDSAGHPSGNQGLRDQQLVLRWLHDNVTAFGGDPARVTLYGQSAGAQGACLHWMSPGSRALVQRYFMQSGSCVQYLNVPLDRKRVAKVSQALVDDLCPGTHDAATCLRALPAEQIALWGAGQLRPMGEDFYPQVDGDVLPFSPLDALARGEVSTAPVIIGTVPHEWAVVLLYGGAEVPHPKSLFELWFYLSVFFGDGTGDVIARYAPLGTADDAADSILERVMSDMMFHCPARSFARRASALGRTVYLYSFELQPAVHGLDIDYLFGTPWISPVMKPPLYQVAAPVPLEPRLVAALQGYAAQFMATGDPNDASGGSGAAVPIPWPSYDERGDRHLVLAPELTTGSALYEQTCDFWDHWHARWDPPPS
jgi:para-nitrobenzyl esterase